MFADQRFAVEHPENSDPAGPGDPIADTSQPARRHSERLRRDRRSSFIS